MLGCKRGTSWEIEVPIAALMSRTSIASAQPFAVAPQIQRKSCPRSTL